MVFISFYRGKATDEATTPEREKRTSTGMEQRAKKTARTQPAESDPSMGKWLAALHAVVTPRFGPTPTDGGKRPCANMMRFGACPSTTECNYSHNMGFWSDKGISKEAVEQKGAGVGSRKSKRKQSRKQQRAARAVALRHPPERAVALR